MKNNKFDSKDSGILSAVDMKDRKNRIIYWIMFAMLCVVACACVLPVLWVFLSAFKDIDEFLSVPPTLLPHSFHPEKIGVVWKKLNFGVYYYNSFLIILGNLAACLVFNGVFGYVLSRLKPKGTKLLYTLVFWTLLMPTSMCMVPLYMSFVKLGLMDSFIPLFIMSGANAYETLLFRNFFNGIPESYVEAAKIDGATNLGIFFKIIMPISKPIIMVVSIFSVQMSWGSFFWPYLILTDERKQPVSIALYTLSSGAVTDDQYVIVMMLAILPVLILFSVFSKYIIGGNNMSGVKG